MSKRAIGTTARAAAVAAAMALILSGCGANSSTPPAEEIDSGTPWDAVVAQAKQEGSVTLYLGLANYEDRISEGFSKAYPDINLTIVRQPSTTLITKLAAEKEAKSEGGDVAILGTYGWFDENKADLVPLTGDSQSLYTTSVDPLAGENYHTDVIVPFVFTSNTELLTKIGADPIETWDDTLQPQLKGLVGMTRPDLIPVQVQHYFAVDQARPDYLEKLSKLSPRLMDSSGTLGQAVAAGDLALGIGTTAPNVAPLIAADAPINVVTATDPSFLIGYAAGIVSWSKHPAAAQVLTNWMLSEEGQQAQHNGGASASVLEGIPGELEVSTEKFSTGALSPEEEAFLPEFKKLFG